VTYKFSDLSIQFVTGR